MNYIGLFIGKQPKKDFYKYEKINSKINNFLEDIDIEIFTKLAFYFGEKIIYKLKTKIKYTFELENVDLREIIYRKIQWIGYMKNSLLDKTICLDNRTHISSICEDDPFEILQGQLFSGLIGTGVGAISGSIIGGIICPHLLIGYIAGGILASLLQDLEVYLVIQFYMIIHLEICLNLRNLN